jgi:hypothetical protein
MSETGQINTLENFATLISICSGYGLRFQPTNDLIKIPALQNVQTLAKQSIQTITAKFNIRKNTNDARKILFAQLPKLASKIVSSLEASANVSETDVETAMSHIRLIRGYRKGKKILNPTPGRPKQISVSHRSYNQLAFHYSNLISFVLLLPAYHPSEPELQEPALHNFETQLNQANQACIEVNAPWKDSLIDRDKIFYEPVTGLVDLALTTKKYVRSVNAITLAEYKLISKLRFTRPKKKK